MQAVSNLLIHNLTLMVAQFRQRIAVRTRGSNRIATMKFEWTSKRADMWEEQ